MKCGTCNDYDAKMVIKDNEGIERCLSCVCKALRELNGLRAFKRNVDEALNSGDGVYRP